MKKSKKLIAVIAAMIFSAAYALISKGLETGNPFQPSTVLFGTVSFLNVIILGSLGYKTFDSYASYPTAKLKKEFIPLYLFFVGASLLISFSLIALGDYLYFVINGYDMSQYFDMLFQKELPGAAKSFFIWILIASAFLFYVIWRQTIEREQLLREENLKYKYKNLKNQVNPHFLFNSLNTLSELIYTDVKKADSYIQKLSGIYRYILDHEDVDLVFLREELDFVKQYVDLCKARAGNAISLEIHIRNIDQFVIIPVSLQILVENAIKHNSMSEESPLKISIHENNGYIEISNVVQRKSTFGHSSGTGLSNLRERTKLIMNKELIIKQERNLFVVELPVTKV